MNQDILVEATIKTSNKEKSSSPTSSYVSKLWDIREKLINMEDRRVVLPENKIAIDLEEGKIVGEQIYFKDEVLINIWDVSEDTEHILHQHNGVEVVFVISGELIVKKYNGLVNITTLRASDCIAFKAHEEHSVFFPRKAKVITITYPAEKGYELNGK